MKVSNKIFKSPISGNTYTRTVIKGSPGLKAAKVAAEKSKEQKKKDEEDAKKKKTPFLPWPAGSSPYHSRRIEDGGKLIRLKRR